MLKNIALTGAAMAVLSSPSFAAIIATWNFESPNPADSTNFAVYPNPIAPATGTGNAGGAHASANTDWTTPVGNGSTDSLSVNEWTVGDYFQFAVSTAGFASIYVSFSETSSNTGPRDFLLQYSTTGIAGPYTTQAAYVVPANVAPNAWSAGLPVPAAFFSFDLSGVSALGNNTDAVFRLADASTVSANGGTVATAGTSRVDNFTVSDTPIAPPVPEPTVALSLILGSGWMLARRRRVA